MWSNGQLMKCEYESICLILHQLLKFSHNLVFILCLETGFGSIRNKHGIKCKSMYLVVLHKTNTPAVSQIASTVPSDHEVAISVLVKSSLESKSVLFYLCVLKTLFRIHKETSTKISKTILRRLVGFSQDERRLYMYIIDCIKSFQIRFYDFARRSLVTYQKRTKTKFWNHRKTSSNNVFKTCCKKTF